MIPEEFPAPTEGLVLTHFLVVSDQDRSRDFLNVRVADIQKVYKAWTAMGAES
jgi:hypothetical protein